MDERRDRIRGLRAELLCDFCAVLWPRIWIELLMLGRPGAYRDDRLLRGTDDERAVRDDRPYLKPWPALRGRSGTHAPTSNLGRHFDELEGPGVAQGGARCYG